MNLICKCGHQWDYQGKALFYAFCPKCKSRTRISNPDKSSNLDLQKWAMAVPIEVSMPQNRDEAIEEAQKYAKEVFGESSLVHIPFFLTHFLKVKHSNYHILLGEVKSVARQQGAITGEISNAYNIVKDRVDHHINDLMSSIWG